MWGKSLLPQAYKVGHRHQSPKLHPPQDSTNGGMRGLNISEANRHGPFMCGTRNIPDPRNKHKLHMPGLGIGAAIVGSEVPLLPPPFDAHQGPAGAGECRIIPVCSMAIPWLYHAWIHRPRLNENRANEACIVYSSMKRGGLGETTGARSCWRWSIMAALWTPLVSLEWIERRTYLGISFPFQMVFKRNAKSLRESATKACCCIGLCRHAFTKY